MHIPVPNLKSIADAKLIDMVYTWPQVILPQSNLFYKVTQS